MKYVLSSLLFIFSLSIGAQHTGPQADIDQILANTKAFSQAIMDSDYTAIGEAYTADAKIFPAKRDIISGTEGILRYWELPNDVRISQHKITAVEIKVLGDEAYDYGYYEGSTLQADGSESSWKGKYVVIWRKDQGTWKIYLDIWNGIDN